MKGKYSLRYLESQNYINVIRTKNTATRQSVQLRDTSPSDVQVTEPVMLGHL